MEKVAKDETDLNFRATLELNTLCDEHDGAVHVNNRHDSVHTMCIRGLWTGHKTLLYRAAVLIFFILLVTLLETLLPSKTGIIGTLLSALTHNNATFIE
jgi:hypothetical protein